MTTIDLDDLGLDAEIVAAFEALGPGHRLGRVSRVDRGECDVLTAEGIVRAASDSLRSQDALAPVTGDWVAVADSDDIGVVVETVLPRSTTITRRDPSEQVIGQVLVANVDVVGVVHGLDRLVNPARLERFLVVALDSGARAVVILTKADLSPDADESRAAVQEIAPDVPVLVASGTTGEGIDQLHDLLVPNRTLVLLGLSGVGKSTLVNALLGEEVQATEAVRQSDAKGRHTTVTRDLIPLPGGGVLIDTPGLRGVGLWSADDGLARVFADIETIAEQCRFRDCRHHAEPACAVRAAVEAGDLAADRLERYQSLVAELEGQLGEREERRRRQQGGRRRRASPRARRRS